jgi:Flp pilus assembly pilin Flp
VAEQPSGFDRSETQSTVASVLDESGQTMTEYAVILTVITVAVVLAIGVLSTNIGAHITDIANLVK